MSNTPKMKRSRYKKEKKQTENSHSSQTRMWQKNNVDYMRLASSCSKHCISTSSMLCFLFAMFCASDCYYNKDRGACGSVQGAEDSSNSACSTGNQHNIQWYKNIIQIKNLTAVRQFACVARSHTIWHFAIGLLNKLCVNQVESSNQPITTK